MTTGSDNEVGPNQGSRQDDGVGSNPELRAQHRPDFLTAEKNNERTSLELFFWRAAAIVELIGGLLVWWLS